MPADTGNDDGGPAHLRSVLAGFTGEKFLYYPGSPNWNDTWDIHTYRKRVQADAGLSAQWAAAFEAAFEEGCGPVVLLCAPFDAHSPELLKKAIAALKQNDLVAATSDGSIFLLGMSSFYQELLLRCPEKAEDVAAYLESAARAGGLALCDIRAGSERASGL